jgi:glutaminyl-tRNA synthetase
MPTLSGMRRRGYTPASIREFCDRVGVARRENVIDVGLLEYCVREDLNRIATRVMVVLDPIKLIIDNYPEGKTETLTGENNPEDENSGERELPFSRELWIERDDFMENPGKKYFRLGPGLMVRLKHAYIIRCESFKKDENGITEIHCTYIPESKSGHDTSGINVKGTIHWVSAAHAVNCEVRMYDRLFSHENPAGEEGDFKQFINADSLKVIPSAIAEPFLASAKLEDKFQFIRKGYFCLDKDSSDGKLIFNQTVALKDSWNKKKE